MVNERIIQRSEAQISRQQPETQCDEQEFERLVNEHRRFLLACASRTVNHFVTEQDDEWSVTLQAFYEAVNTYDPCRGELQSFASVCIRRRLTDWMRTAYRRREEPEEEIPEALPDGEHWPGEYTISDEIEAVQEELKSFGFSFFDVADSSPKAQKSRKKCAAVIAALMRDEELYQSMFRTGMLPAKTLTKASGISGKVIEKHRRYIIAAAIILHGDYPLLSEYLHTVREEMKR